MSQSKSKLVIAVLAFVVLAMASLACGSSDNPVDAAPELTEWEIRVEGARSRNAALFQYEGDSEGMALCYGSTFLGSLDEDVQELKLMYQPPDAAPVDLSLNLSLCVRNPETGNYDFVQSLSGISPGDSLHWNSEGQLGWVR